VDVSLYAISHQEVTKNDRHFLPFLYGLFPHLSSAYACLSQFLLPVNSDEFSTLAFPILALCPSKWSKWYFTPFSRGCVFDVLLPGFL